MLYKNYGSSEGMSYRGFFTSAAFWAGVGLCVSNVVGGLYWKREFAQAERSAALGQARGSGADDDVGVDPSPWEAPHPVSSTASTTPMQTTRVLGVGGHDVVDSGRCQRGRRSVSAGGMRPMVVVVVHPHGQRLTPSCL